MEQFFLEMMSTCEHEICRHAQYYHAQYMSM